MRLFSSTILALKLPSKDPNVCCTCGGRSVGGGGVFDASSSAVILPSPSTEPAISEENALESMGKISQRRIPRFEEGAVVVPLICAPACAGAGGFCAPARSDCRPVVSCPPS